MLKFTETTTNLRHVSRWAWVDVCCIGFINPNPFSCMRPSDEKKVLEALRELTPSIIIPVIQQDIESEKLILSANETLDNELSAIQSIQKITELKLLLRILRCKEGL